MLVQSTDGLCYSYCHGDPLPKIINDGLDQIHRSMNAL